MQNLGSCEYFMRKTPCSLIILVWRFSGFHGVRSWGDRCFYLSKFFNFCARTADQSWLLSDMLINLKLKWSIFVISLHKKQTLNFSSCFSDNNAALLEMHPTLWYAGIRITSQTAKTSVLFLHSNGKMKSCFKLNCEWSRFRADLLVEFVKQLWVLCVLIPVWFI